MPLKKHLLFFLIASFLLALGHDLFPHHHLEQIIHVNYGEKEFHEDSETSESDYIFSIIQHPGFFLLSYVKEIFSFYIKICWTEVVKSEIKFALKVHLITTSIFTILFVTFSGCILENKSSLRAPPNLIIL